MTINEAHKFFEGLNDEAKKKSEKKIYEKFISVLSGLKNKDLSAEEVQWIETELDGLNLKSNPKNRKKYYRKAFAKFEKYLKDKLSLTSKGYYTNLGVSLGVLFGVVAGVLIGERFEKSLGISFGISMGMLIGAVIGSRLDLKAKNAGTMLN